MNLHARGIPNKGKNKMKLTNLFVIAIAAACLFACMPGVSAASDQSGNGDHSITVA